MTSEQTLRLGVENMPRTLPRVVAVLTHRIGGVQQLEARCEDGGSGRINVVLATGTRGSAELLAHQLGRIVGVTSVQCMNNEAAPRMREAG